MLSCLASLSLKDKKGNMKMRWVPLLLIIWFCSSTETLNRSLVTTGWAGKYQKIASGFSVKSTLTILGSNETTTDTKAKMDLKIK